MLFSNNKTDKTSALQQQANSSKVAAFNDAFYEQQAVPDNSSYYNESFAQAPDDHLHALKNHPPAMADNNDNHQNDRRSWRRRRRRRRGNNHNRGRYIPDNDEILQEAVDAQAALLDYYEEVRFERLLNFVRCVERNEQNKQEEQILRASVGIGTRRGLSEDDTVIDTRPSLPKRTPLPRRTEYTCQCCFETFALDYTPVVKCSSTRHLFCTDCVRKHAEICIFERKQLNHNTDDEPRLQCMAPDCPAHFVDAQLHKALNQRVMQHYQQLQVQLALRQAGITNLSCCEKCGFQMQVEEHSEGFTCPQCRQYHPGEEQEQSTPSVPSSDSVSSSARAAHLLEEALTNAKIRTCPNCRTKFLRESNTCNKIKCPGCGTRMCYICRKVVPTKGYDHFSNRPFPFNKTTDKCPLWTNDKQDAKRDRTAMRKEGTHVANQVWEESLLKGKPQEKVHKVLSELLEEDVQRK